MISSARSSGSPAFSSVASSRVIAISWSRVTFFGTNQARRSRAPAGGRRAGAARGRARDLHRHQALVAQAVDDLGFVGGLELAGGDVAGRVDGPVAVDGHGRRPSSRASRGGLPRTW